VPFARGGPVFVPFMVGPISTVPEFLSSTLREVQVPCLTPPAKTLALRFAQIFGMMTPCFRLRAVPA
jgi:hypothetical protein